MADGTSTPPRAARQPEIDRTNNLFRRATEAYLSQNGENDFERFQLYYNASTQTISITDWDYTDITQPTRAQLIALTGAAKKRLRRFKQQDRRRGKNRKRGNIPPAVYMQVGTSHTGTGAWKAVPMREYDDTSSGTIDIDASGIYRVSLSGKCNAGTGSGSLRVLNSARELILQSSHQLVGSVEVSFGDFVDVDLSENEQLTVEQEGTATMVVAVAIEIIIPK